MNMQLSRTPQQIERRYQSQQTKAMISMQMRNKNMIQAGKLQSGLAELQFDPSPQSII
jgi:hypothetical protein